jgi:hypothetical protein
LIHLFTHQERNRKWRKSNDCYNLAISHFWYLGLLLVWTWSFVSCTLPGGNRTPPPQIKLTIQNTLPIKRTDVPIVLTLDALKKVAPDFSFDAYLVVSGQPPTELHSQADDMNYDGQKDELVFLIDLEPQETREVVIRYAPKNQMAVTLEFTKRTRAGIFPELKGLAALESEFNAYLLNPNGSIQAYRKKEELLFSAEASLQNDLDNRGPISANLQRTFESHSIRLPQNTTIEIKQQGYSWLITNPDNKQRYFVRKDKNQLNIYKAEELAIDRLVHQVATHSATNDIRRIEFIEIMTPLPTYGLGCGGFAIWDKANQKLISPPEVTQDYVRVLANGPVRSVVQWIIPNWQLSTKTIHFTSTVSIYAGHRWGEHRIKVQGLEARYRIATGVPNLEGSFGGVVWGGLNPTKNPQKKKK